MNNEARLIELARQGDNTAFEQLLRPYGPRLLNLAVQVTGNREDGQEACQEAMIKVFRYLRSFKQGKNFKSWLFKTVVNSSLDVVKKKGRHNSLPDHAAETVPAADATPEEHFHSDGIDQRIAHCLQQLTPGERTVFYLREEEGLSIKEAAAVIGKSSISVRVHLSQARKKLRHLLAEIYEIKQDFKQNFKQDLEQDLEQEPKTHEVNQ